MAKVHRRRYRCCGAPRVAPASRADFCRRESWPQPNAGNDGEPALITTPSRSFQHRVGKNIAGHDRKPSLPLRFSVKTGDAGSRGIAEFVGRGGIVAHGRVELGQAKAGVMPKRAALGVDPGTFPSDAAGAHLASLRDNASPEPLVNQAQDPSEETASSGDAQAQAKRPFKRSRATAS